jgi:hypothetical protein
MIPAALAAPLFLGWISLSKYEQLPFPTSALLWYLPSIASIGLGAWTWRTKRVWWFASLVAILGGAFGISFAAIFVFFGLLVRVF